jgi:hypothetical protein
MGVLEAHPGTADIEDVRHPQVSVDRTPGTARRFSVTSSTIWSCVAVTAPMSRSWRPAITATSVNLAHRRQRSGHPVDTARIDVDPGLWS